MDFYEIKSNAANYRKPTLEERTSLILEVDRLRGELAGKDRDMHAQLVACDDKWKKIVAQHEARIEQLEMALQRIACGDTSAGFGPMHTHQMRNVAKAALKGDTQGT